MIYQELVKTVQEQYEIRFEEKVSYEKIRFLVDSLFKTITSNIAKGIRVKVTNFGVFDVNKLKGHSGFNAIHKVEYYVQGRNLPTFRSSKNLKKAVMSESTGE